MGIFDLTFSRMQKIKMLFLIVAVSSLTGCATSRSIIDIPSRVPQEAQVAATVDGKVVYIATVIDSRTFQERPPSPNIPSLDPSEASSHAIRSRAIGRKRNTYGKALGDILLKEGTTVESLTSSAIRRAFSENGYMVLDNSSQVTPNVFVVNANIDQFWTWMNPGFWAITLSAEISTNLHIKQGAHEQHLIVQSKSSDRFQTGAEGNYIQVIADALKLFTEELKRKLKSLE